MNLKLAQLLVRLYPRRWRERYGAEFEAFLVDGYGGAGGEIRPAADVAWAAFCEHIFPSPGGNMETNPRSFGAVLRHPSAFVPVAMSVTALAMVLGYLGLYGIARQTDEGAIAHLWQILMAGQAPVIVFFAIKWLPRAPRQSLGVLALQAGAALASIAPVFFLNL